MPTQFVGRQIADAAITYAKIQNVTTNKLLGRATAASGIVEEITLGTGLSFTGTTLNVTSSGGTVTTVSITTGNGFAGSVLNPTTTPSITLSTTITGLLKGNGTAISAAVANTDYLDTTYTGFDTRYLRLIGGTMTGFITLHADPTSAMHAATKQYVDSQATGLSWKNAVRVATVGNITLSGTQVVDSVTVAVGDRVLVKNQTTTSQNGIYVVSATAWTRSLDADSSIELDSATVMVEYGSQANTQWTETATIITIGTDVVTFAQISGTGTYTNGTGITLTGNVFALDTTYTNSLYVPVGRNLTINGSSQTLAADRTFTITSTGTINRITVTGGATITPTIDIASTYVGQASITTLGTVTTGVWNATAINLSTYASGVLQAAQFPALTGEATTTVGSLVVTLTNSAVIGKVLTGFVASAGTVVATDSILQAFQKIAANEGTFLQSSRFIFNEVPTGAVNGVNTTFALANTPTTGKTMIFLNGQKLRPTTDYSITGSTITMVVAPTATPTTDVVDVTYIY